MNQTAASTSTSETFSVASAASAASKAVERLTSSPQLEGLPWRQTGELLAWSALIAIGARRGGLLGVAAMGIGLDRLSRLTLGTSLSHLVLTAVRPATPQYQFGDGERDLVDEASWESFPASDPPGRGVG